MSAWFRYNCHDDLCHFFLSLLNFEHDNPWSSKFMIFMLFTTYVKWRSFLLNSFTCLDVWLYLHMFGCFIFPPHGWMLDFPLHDLKSLIFSLHAKFLVKSLPIFISRSWYAFTCNECNDMWQFLVCHMHAFTTTWMLNMLIFFSLQLVGCLTCLNFCFSLYTVLGWHILWI